MELVSGTYSGVRLRGRYQSQVSDEIDVVCSDRDPTRTVKFSEKWDKKRIKVSCVMEG